MAWEMTRQLFATVAQANGQIVERRVKVKELRSTKPDGSTCCRG